MKFSLLVAILLTASIITNAQKPEINQKDGIAILGYDPVAFFMDQKQTKGSPTFTTEWKKATWYFISKSNMEKFIQSPETYAPQYGGYCAYGTARGYKAPVEIDTWTIIDKKLYFNYNEKVKVEWSKDMQGYIKKADEQWVLIKDR